MWEGARQVLAIPVWNGLCHLGLAEESAYLLVTSTPKKHIVGDYEWFIWVVSCALLKVKQETAGKAKGRAALLPMRYTYVIFSSNLILFSYGKCCRQAGQSLGKNKGVNNQTWPGGTHGQPAVFIAGAEWILIECFPMASSWCMTTII